MNGQLFPTPQEALTKDDYYTPGWVFRRLDLRFDIDVAAPPGGVGWVPADQYFTQEDDGLTMPWKGRVWMNPPFSNSSPWVRRFIEHRHGICLVPHSRSAWWIELWDSADGFADGGMFQFYRPGEGDQDGRYENIFMPVMFAAFGEECVEALHRIGVVRKATP